MNPGNLLTRLLARESLSSNEMEEVIGRIVDGELPEPLVAGLLVALAAKGENTEELTGAARALRSRMLRVPSVPEGAIDTCGTGGDGRGTFNVSTAAAFVVAAAGVPVAKHGNRAVSSRAGSSDVLTALGIPVDVGPEVASQSLARYGLAFLYAPAHHPAMKAVAAVRRALGVRTVFNLVGPLSNPAGVRRQLIGVFSAHWVEPIAYVARELGAERVMVVHGSDGTDEITTTGLTQFAELVDGEVQRGWIDPQKLGIPRATPADLIGGSPAENAALLERILGGEKGPAADVVSLNAAAALFVAGRVADLRAGLELARQVLSAGSALALLERMRQERE